MDSGKSSASPVKVFVCISGSEFSFRAHNCFAGLMMGFFKNMDKYAVVGIKYGPSENRDLSRAICFTNNYMDKRPLEGIDYDVLLNIDNDILYTFEQVQSLIDSCTGESKVVLGSYRISTEDISNVSRNNSDDSISLKSMSMKTLAGHFEENKEEPLMKVSHGSLGLFVARKEAMDSLEYPYFDHTPVSASNGEKEVRELLNGDIVICIKFRTAGFQPYVHTGVIANREYQAVM